MKTTLIGTALFVLTAAAVAFYPALKTSGSVVGTNNPTPVRVDPVRTDKPKIDVVFVLDTTGSMSGLIGAAIAAVLAVAAGATFAGLTVSLTQSLAVRIVVTLLAGSYALYLMYQSNERTGRIVTVAGWCVGATVIGAFVPTLTLFLIAHTCLIWLVRTLYFHESTLTALSDLGLSALALASGIWALRSSYSLSLATWSFFLVQALFVMLPSLQPRTPQADDGNHAFQRAQRSADAALRRLAAGS